MELLSAKRCRLSVVGIYLLFLGPALLLFLMLKFLPLVNGFLYSFTNWNGISAEFNFAGLDNYIKLFTQDKQFWKSLTFTLSYGVISVTFINIFAFTFAYYLSKKIPMRNVMRAGIYLPDVIGGIILGYVWQFVFLKSFPAIGEATGIQFFSQLWLGDMSTAFYAMVIVQIWRKTGYAMLIYIAGFTTISNDYIEAATIDGAKQRHILWNIILPLMRPSITRALFITILDTLRVYDMNVSLTGGGPYRASETITLNIRTTAFTENFMGYGSAKAMIFIIIIVAITLIQVALTSRKEVNL